jgi:hypothetical protein
MLGDDLPLLSDVLYLLQLGVHVLHDLLCHPEMTKRLTPLHPVEMLLLIVVQYLPHLEIDMGPIGQGTVVVPVRVAHRQIPLPREKRTICRPRKTTKAQI